MDFTPSPAAVSIETALLLASQQLQQSGIESAKLDASVLLCHVLDKPNSYLFTWPEKLLETAQLESFNALLQRRMAGEPVAYIVGTREFWSLELEVSPTTLIPRPDTERLVELALDKCTSHSRILDLGTGTGAIALALASELPQSQVTGVDFQVDAVALATRNRDKLGLTHAEFTHSDWFSALSDSAPFDVIVSNPPYIDEQDPHLSQGDVRFEPRSALTAADNGLADLEHITQHARAHLSAQGWLLMEHGFEQGEAVREILTRYGFTNVVTEQDYANNDRVTIGQWPSSCD